MSMVALFVSLCVRGAFAQDDNGADPGWTGVLDEASFAALHELNEEEAPPARGDLIELGDARAYLSLPDGDGPHPGVVVIHEWWGLNDHIRHWTDRLAADGYAALAVDLYGGVVATTREEAMGAMRSVDEEAATATLLAAHRFLKDDPRIRASKRASIGWCFGGGWSLKLSMAAPELDAAVVYYGRLVTDVDALRPIEAPLLGVFGERDRGIPPESVHAFEAAMKEAENEVTVHLFDAEHAFANPSSARYDAENAAAAWKVTRAFLREHLTGAAPAERQSAQLGTTEVTYVVPGGFEDAGPRTMRNVNLVSGAGTELYAMSMPGAAGGVGPNAQRWRRQLGAAALTPLELADLPRLTVLGVEAVVVDVAGRFQGMGGQVIDDARMLGLICPLDDHTVFVKMIGPRADVDEHEDAFREFCESFEVAK